MTWSNYCLHTHSHTSHRHRVPLQCVRGILRCKQATVKAAKLALDFLDAIQSPRLAMNDGDDLRGIFLRASCRMSGNACSTCALTSAHLLAPAPPSLCGLHVLDAHLQHAVCHAIMTQRSVICVCSDGSHGVRRIRGNVQGAAADVTARSVRVAHGAGTSQKTKRCLQLGRVAWTRPQTCGNAQAPTLLACLPSCVTAQLPASAAGAASLHSIICQQMPPPLIVLRILINV